MVVFPAHDVPSQQPQTSEEMERSKETPTESPVSNQDEDVDESPGLDASRSTVSP